MSVLRDDIVKLYPFAGFTDPALPMGTWASLITVPGDAGGGVRTAQCNFSVQGQASPALFFSLEQLYFTDAENVTRDLAVILQNMLSVGQVFTKAFSWGLIANVAGVASREPTQAAMEPMFLGSPLKGTTGAIRAAVGNSDGDDFVMNAEGYYWSARSLNAEGGLRRPASGLYSPR